MNIRDVEQRLKTLDVDAEPEFIFQLLLAYGHPKAAIKRLQSTGRGSYDRSGRGGEVLWRDRLYYSSVGGDETDLYGLVDTAAKDQRITRQRPRFVIVRNAKRLAALDTKTHETLSIELDELSEHAAFFMPWAGVEKVTIEATHYADVKAAERMAKLYDEIAKLNDTESDGAIHSLNIFFTRLLFCFFAEDTGVFEKGLFSDTLASVTQDSGNDVAGFLDDLFAVLNTEPGARTCPAHFRAFGYVNGKLFAEPAAAPTFSAKARNIVLECAALDWSQINPDIFGSMIQAVVHPSHREGLGMHYTSVENIMKVLRPLFLDELHEAYAAAADSASKLEKLLDRIGNIKVFDPACGSGNFLVIAYKELRKLENQVMQRLLELRVGKKQHLFHDSMVHLDNFYGIEIDDFAHEVAILSLYLAKHQMNVEFQELFGFNIPLIPLKETGQIVCGNATRLDWNAVCPLENEDEVYVCGNPPYAGSSMQRSEQKQDFVEFFRSNTYPKNLDYISLWFFKGAEFVRARGARLGFVSTVTVCHGDHVGLMWPTILDQGVEIAFAHESFSWGNSAKGNAVVFCVVIGLAHQPSKRILYARGARKEVANINPYLHDVESNTIVHASRSPLNPLPPMVLGNKPTDGGHLSMTRVERDELLDAAPEAAEFVRRYVGAHEAIYGIERYCLWIADADAQRAAAIPAIARRLDQVKAMRLQGSTTAQAMASKPYRFLQRAHKETNAVIVPIHTSENRDYIPIGFVGIDTIISNAANAVYDAEPWVFGLIQSDMHMVWVRAVAGRYGPSLRYSNTLVYNTFPVPDLTDSGKAALTKAANRVLGTREVFSENTLAELYDPDKMPPPLREAHAALDQVVDDLYESKGFESDEQRLERLFEMYAKLTEAPIPETLNA